MFFRVAYAHSAHHYCAPFFKTLGAAEQYARNLTRRKRKKTLVFWTSIGRSPILAAEVQFDGMMRLWTDLTLWGVSWEHKERPYVFIEDKD